MGLAEWWKLTQEDAKEKFSQDECTDPVIFRIRTYKTLRSKCDQDALASVFPVTKP